MPELNLTPVERAVIDLHALRVTIRKFSEESEEGTANQISKILGAVVDNLRESLPADHFLQRLVLEGDHARIKQV